MDFLRSHQNWAIKFGQPAQQAAGIRLQIGSSTRKVLPSYNLLSTSIWPLWASTILLAIASPRLVPGMPRVLLPSLGKTRQRSGPNPFSQFHPRISISIRKGVDLPPPDQNLPPRRLYLIALSRRLVKTRVRSSRFAETSPSSSGSSISNISPAPWLLPSLVPRSLSARGSAESFSFSLATLPAAFARSPGDPRSGPGVPGFSPGIVPGSSGSSWGPPPDPVQNYVQVSFDRRQRGAQLMGHHGNKSGFGLVQLL